MSVAYRHRRFSFAQITYTVTVVLKKDLIVFVVVVVD